MITVRYHYKDQDDRAMKCAELFLNRLYFEEWYAKYKDKIKNVSITGL